MVFPLPSRFADATAIVLRTNGGGRYHADTLVQRCLSYNTVDNPTNMVHLP